MSRFGAEFKHDFQYSTRLSVAPYAGIVDESIQAAAAIRDRADQVLDGVFLRQLDQRKPSFRGPDGSARIEPP